MVFFNACGGVFTIFLIALVGYALARWNLVPQSAERVLPRFVTTIALPPYLFRHITATFHRDDLVALLSGAVIPFVSIGVMIVLAWAFSGALNIRHGRAGAFRTAFATSSTMNIGLPINIALFGETAVPYVLLYFLPNALTFWTFGNYSLAHDGKSANIRLFSRETLKQICSPPLMGFLLGLAVVFLDVRLPVFMDNTIKYVGDMALALAIMYIGIMLSGIKLADCTLERDSLVVFIGRFVISPLCVLLLSLVIPVPPLMLGVFLIQSSLPVMLNVAILAGYYGGDVKFATMVTSLSTVMALVTIPLYMVLIGYFLL